MWSSRIEGGNPHSGFLDDMLIKACVNEQIMATVKVSQGQTYIHLTKNFKVTFFLTHYLHEAYTLLQLKQ